MKNVLARDLPVLEEPTEENPNPFFTRELFFDWYNKLYDCICKTIATLQDKTGYIEGIDYQLNPTILDEAIYDAIFSLKKVINSEYHDIKKPNPFKIAAHLGYWVVRHKPVLFIQYDVNYDLNNVVFPKDIQEIDEKRKIAIWEMKHINELVAANFMLRYIFDFDSTHCCRKRQLNNVQKNNIFCFNDFDDMVSVISDKLKYHLTYRNISPEIIEHFLEGYTLHPALKLTADLWKIDE